MDEQQAYREHVFPNIEDWPIYQLSEDRKAFVQEIVQFTLERFLSKPTSELTDIISKTIYLERIRIKEEPWKVDPPNEAQFWRKVGKQLIGYSLDRTETEAAQTNEEILRKIITRYAEEIVGTFRIKTFLFARKFLTLFFTRLLNAATRIYLGRKRKAQERLSNRMLVKGRVEEVRALMKKGIVVVVPTHFSNLDSILIGYAMDTFAGLPSFSYGAGLNLYNTGYTAYFMNRLGAYRVDRRKKNPIYLETLKAMSNLSIQRGVNSLFFPGGTRSRSGALESKLKLGLLGTAVEAQRALFEKGEQKKIFIVPLVLSYHFVLEAPFLIEQHLRAIGKERYIKSKDDFYSLRKILKFAWRFFAESNDITLSFGQPMDVLGNFVDADGNSFDKSERPVQLQEYFFTDGKVVKHLQRESEYTRILADEIAERYHIDNIVLSSHLLAFAAFEVLKKENSRLDLYGILRLPEDEYVFPLETVKEVVYQLREKLFVLKDQEKIQLSDQIYWDLDDLIQHGIKRLGSYHLDSPLRFNKKGELVSDSFKILYFYHNRMDNYGLASAIEWKQVPQAQQRWSEWPEMTAG
ncbi:MAG TPA: 1-acyl-sn-glycerol-3-phosphate acyltransferase [Saprospiraceae bacterium]|nr:1-acyl-sn-glycerol-3-phosphate acyltransferase [Saprospiraceae bacterium]HMQ84499.1 1-acyl-sn-glycerol-3-phosphate acyltransferase [Saprospiraceae bacterium]